METVKVAVRIRPLVSSEIDLGCKPCVQRINNEPQVSIGKGNQLFTYNYVFDESEGQNKVYNSAVKCLIDNLFKGYNVTILAYGQTGSGKTFTMGTNYSGEGELGVIPRAVYDIFEKIKTISDQDFRLSVNFIELYNESLYDLLTQRPREQSIVDLREQGNGICIPGLTELEVSSPEETLERLKDGSLGRVVGSTAMNAQSSRSHAIFTINIRIIPKENTNEIMTAKFHLVDLAGSERSKKTGTTGDRFKEGVNINMGLLNLGNVISQLGEGKYGFINYRDSKLTRLLQDSLGGNSVTLMIACISPADYNQDETLSTLRYADRARKIKNKPIVNQDPRLAELIKLRKENEELRIQILQDGKAFQCPPEHKLLQIQLSDSQKMINQLSKSLSEALIQNANMHEKALSIETAETTLKEKLNELKSLSESASGEDPILNEFKAKLCEVEAQQKAFEHEILSFDKNAANEDEDNEEDIDGDDAAQNGQMSERRNEHILSQSKINKELLALTKNLTWKEELVAKLTASADHLDQMQAVASVNSLKQQIAELQQEREELLKQIRLNSNSQNSSAKIAETRRKRLQELEAKVSALMKKVQEQERIIKMKEKSDEKIITLRQEIHSMKQMKVKLIQQMKTENEKFKVFKAQKDREVCQLRTQNQKRQNQLKRMEQMHTSQQNVLRRKLEASAAANKRLMAVLERQKAAREKKIKGFASEVIKERINEEIELLESAYEAQKSLENLLQDRASLTKELGVIKESLVDDNVSEQEKVKLRIDMKQIEQELEYRSAEISDLQQKLLDIHQDDRTRNNWESLHSMADAKFALSHLFNLASEKIKDILDKSSHLAELKEQQAEMEQRLNDCVTRLESTETFYKKALEKMEKDCEEKVCLFMKLATEKSEDSMNPGLSDALKSQFKEMAEMNLHYVNKIKELEEELEKACATNKAGANTSLDAFQKFLEERTCDTTFIVPGKKKSKLSKQSSRRDTFEVVDEETLKALDSSQEFDPDDTEKDPDWRNTPIHKRLKALKKDNKLGKRTGSNGSEKCGCNGRCRVSCPCYKTSSPCNENCSCDGSQCALKKPRFSSRINISGENPQNEMETDL